MKLIYKYLMVASWICFANISYGQTNRTDTIILRDVLLSKIASERLYAFKATNKDAYISNLIFKKNDSTISLNYRGQFPLYMDKDGENGLITVGNALNCVLKTGKRYTIELTKQCDDEQLKYTYYYYFARFDKINCSSFTILSPLKVLPKKSLFYYNHYFIDMNGELYKIKIIDCTNEIN